MPTRFPGKLSLDQCNAACSSQNFKYSGRQYDGECWCGNGNYAKHGSSTSCGACDGPNVGGYLSCVYEDTQVGSPPATPAPTAPPTHSPTIPLNPTPTALLTPKPSSIPNLVSQCFLLILVIFKS